MAAALDAARAAVRAGVTDVRMMSLESFDELPVMRTAQGKEEFEEAEREGIHFHPQRGARRFIGRDGRVEAMELIGVAPHVRRQRPVQSGVRRVHSRDDGGRHGDSGDRAAGRPELPEPRGRRRA